MLNIKVKATWIKKTPSLKIYLNKIRLYWKGVRYNLEISDTWKFHLAIPNNFIFSLDNYEECIMDLKSDNIQKVIHLKTYIK